MIKLSCHCGKINITVPASITTVTSCNCSVCSKYASLWAYFSPVDVQISAATDAINSYCWGDKSIIFHHCKNCGCVTHYTPTELGNKNRMAVNFRLADLTLINSMNIRYFDGADTWQEIEK